MNDDMVVDFRNANGEWNTRLIRDLLPSHIANKIVALHPLVDVGQIDMVAWMWSMDGSFSIAFAYAFIVGHNDLHKNPLTEIVWNWKGPLRIILLLWWLVSNGLPTNELRLHKKMTDSGSCPRCTSLETELHLFRDCSFARKVWCSLLNITVQHPFFSGDLDSWCMHNLRISGEKIGEVEWNLVFCNRCVVEL
ncbi:unnamed protein product [Lupinus luteus]|uniref:Reverse transcriptase zinc-binding domain-containing protein n=1 Tax=Lupinus luteus TaxID=3873 RepID=A0AAV1XI37_LUPLU